MHLGREVVHGGTMLVVGLLAFASFGLNGASASNGTWGEPTPAEFASGAQFNSPDARFNSVSCASEGNCTAVGSFKNAAGFIEALTMTSTGGVWGQATPAVFASGMENTGEDSRLKSVSCASAGNCTAVGTFKTAAGGFEAFTMTSTNGVWGQATQAVFPFGRRDFSRDAFFNSVSCASAGNCSAVGSFMNATGGDEAFTMTSTNGVWSQATPAVFASGVQFNVPQSRFTSMSCALAENCTAVGSFKTATGGFEAFTMTSTNGVWGQAMPAVFASGVQFNVPNSELVSVSCTSVGNCTAAGYLLNVNQEGEAFTMSSTNGVWGQATPAVFASGDQAPSRDAIFTSVSCVSAGNCTAVGLFSSTTSSGFPFTMTSTNGVWGQAIPVVFANSVRTINIPDHSFLSVSCASAGNCTVAGSFKNSNIVSFYDAFTLTSTNGVWGQATTVVFDSGLQFAVPMAGITSVSCASAGNCTAVGFFANAGQGIEAFTMRSTYNPPASTTTVTQVAALPTTGSRSDGWLVAGMFTVIAGTVLLTHRRRIV
jgi:LPXTG-motif cell wall-anchored protein